MTWTEADVERVARDLWILDQYGPEADNDAQRELRKVMWAEHGDESYRTCSSFVRGRDHWRELARAALAAGLTTGEKE